MFPWFQWTTIQFGPISIQVWGLLVALGIIISLIILRQFSPHFGFRSEEVFDLAFWMILFGFFIARIFHVFLYEPGWYLANPIEIIKVWHGGFSSFGGFLGAILAFFFYSRRTKWKKERRKMADLFAFAGLFGWIIGRVGCVMIHDHLGRSSDYFFALNSPLGPRLDMALLEIIGLLPLAILFFAMRKKDKVAGWFLSVLFLYYGILRFILDFFRATDIASADVRYFGLTPAQYFAIVMTAVGAWFFLRKLPKKWRIFVITILALILCSLGIWWYVEWKTVCGNCGSMF